MQEPPAPTPRSLLGLGVAWTRIGYAVLALATVAFLLNLLVRPLVPVQALAPLAAGAPAPAGTTLVDTPKGKVAVPQGFEMAYEGGFAQAYPAGYRLIGGGKGGAALKPTALGAGSVFLMVFAALVGLVWTLVDIVDRRKRFVWLLPMFICPLVFSLQALPLALYIFFGRETIGHGEGV